MAWRDVFGNLRGDSDGGYGLDGKWYNPGEARPDHSGIFRRPGEAGYDSSGNLRSNGGYDSDGNWTSHPW